MVEKKCEEEGLNIEDYQSTGGVRPELSLVGESYEKETPTNNSEVIVQTPVVEVVHEHEYTSKITKEPTCIEEGEKTFTCSCGEKYTEPIETVAHTYDMDIITKVNTCTEKGIRRIWCSVCNDTYEEDIEPLGHEKGEWVTSKAATCTETGEEVINCKRCDEVLESKEIPATEHIKGEWEIEKEGTIFHEGSKIQRCTTCGEILVTEIIPINTKGWYMVGGLVIVAVVTGGILLRKQKHINNK